LQLRTVTVGKQHARVASYCTIMALDAATAGGGLLLLLLSTAAVVVVVDGLELNCTSAAGPDETFLHVVCDITLDDYPSETGSKLMCVDGGTATTYTYWDDPSGTYHPSQQYTTVSREACILTSAVQDDSSGNSTALSSSPTCFYTLYDSPTFADGLAGPEPGRALCWDASTGEVLVLENGTTAFEQMTMCFGPGCNVTLHEAILDVDVGNATSDVGNQTETAAAEEEFDYFDQGEKDHDVIFADEETFGENEQIQNNEAQLPAENEEEDVQQHQQEGQQEEIGGEGDVAASNPPQETSLTVGAGDNNDSSPAEENVGDTATSAGACAAGEEVSVVVTMGFDQYPEEVSVLVSCDGVAVRTIPQGWFRDTKYAEKTWVGKMCLAMSSSEYREYEKCEATIIDEYGDGFTVGSQHGFFSVDVDGRRIGYYNSRDGQFSSRTYCLFGSGCSDAAAGNGSIVGSFEEEQGANFAGTGGKCDVVDVVLTLDAYPSETGMYAECLNAPDQFDYPQGTFKPDEAYTTFAASIGCIDYETTCCKLTILDSERFGDGLTGTDDSGGAAAPRYGALEVTLTTSAAVDGGGSETTVLYLYDGADPDAERFVEKTIDIGMAC